MKLLIFIYISTLCQISIADNDDAIAPKIINPDVTDGDTSYVVGLTSSDNVFCSGGLIHQKFILTAASCFRKQSIWRVQFDPITENYKDGVFVKDYYIQPSYNDKNLFHNLAIVELEESAPLKVSILIVSQEKDQYFGNGIVSGYGEAEINGDTKIARQRNVRIVDLIDCQRVTQNAFYKLCTVAAVACEEDNGGPLVIGNKIFGVISFEYMNDACQGGGNSVTIYTRVAVYRNWIKSTTKLNII